jgi:hypothetical protein
MRIRTTLLLSILALALVACGSDDDTPTQPGPPSSFEDLSQRWHVLHNLENVFNLQNATEYDRLLDEDFVFFFSTEDVASGNYPTNWDRSVDFPATQRLLSDVLAIDLDIDLSQLSWVEITPDQGMYPGEKWYTTTVPYQFSMRFNQDPETTFLTSGTEGTQFTVRQVEVSGQQRWRLVEWRDLATSNN